jgi:hypothetical protein
MAVEEQGESCRKKKRSAFSALYLNKQFKNAATKRFRRLGQNEPSVVKQTTGAEENVPYSKQGMHR